MKNQMALQPMYDQQANAPAQGGGMFGNAFQDAAQAAPSGSGLGGMLPGLIGRVIRGAQGLQQQQQQQSPPPRLSLQERIAQQPPMQNPWANNRQVQQRGWNPQPDRQQMMAQMLRSGGQNG